MPPMPAKSTMQTRKPAPRKAGQNRPAKKKPAAKGSAPGKASPPGRRSAQKPPRTGFGQSGAPPSLPTGTTNLSLGKTQATVTKGKTTSLRLVRVIKAPAERIYQCFLDPDAMVKWLPPHGFTGKMHRSDAKVGGGYRMSFATIGRTWGHTFTGTYVELVPAKRIRYTNRFEADDPVMANAEMQVTIDLKPVPGGTELTILQQGIPAGPAAEGAPYGWSQSLENLANLCEAELPF